MKWIKMAEATLGVLENRSGFDHWWDGVDHQTQDEIKVAISVALETAATDGKVVLVSGELWRQVQLDIVKLRALESSDVDNWEGYDAAMAGLRHG